MSADLHVTVLTSLDQITERDWDACANPQGATLRPVDPFTTYRFLSALEKSGSVGGRSGWDPRYLTVYESGQLIACAPLYGKYHSQGEYIFDHPWAQALENAGGRYYPKLQIAVPFTPATGRRFLTRPGYEVKGTTALLEGAIELAAQNELSSMHVTFCTEAEALAGGEMGLLHRITSQYHWHNPGYRDFDAFLAALSARKRKIIRKERQSAHSFGGTIRTLTADQIKPQHWDAFWLFYMETGSRKWGSPYLTRQFFNIAHETMRDDIALVLCEREGRPIAGALNFIGRSALYGRYWGCIEHHPCLHFEACYYQAIEFAITHGLDRVEAGAQGDHKLARGYLPVRTHSLHWIANSSFRRAVSEYLDAEREAVSEDIEVITGFGPFRKTARQEHD